MSDWFELPLFKNSNQSRFCGMETWIKDFFVHNKSLNARWSTKWSWILSLYHLINRLNKQDFTLSSLNLHWAFELDKKNGGEIKLTLQLKITTPESDKWKLVLKAFYVTSISSIQISSNFAVIVNAWCSVLFLPSHCKVSKTSYTNKA